VYDQQFWKQKYQERWPSPNGIQVQQLMFSREEKEFEEKEKLLKLDWYSGYKHRAQADEHFSVVVVEVGYETTRLDVTGNFARSVPCVQISSKLAYVSGKK
jgi:hypothetical protein